MAEVTLTQGDNGKTIQVRQGDMLIIQLAENPTTGYRWAVDTLDGSIIALQGSDYAQSPDSAIGGGGARTFSVRAEQAGTAQLVLTHRREWEGADSGTDRFSATIQVSSTTTGSSQH